jgi:hypothetical protein
MPSYGMLRRVPLVITDVSEELRTSFIKVTEDAIIQEFYFSTLNRNLK